MNPDRREETTRNMMSQENLLVQAENVSKYFRRMSPDGRKEWFTAVDQVSFSVAQGEILGLLGESGCGKSTIAKMLMGLERPDEGKILWDGQEIQELTSRQFRVLRRDIQMIFQNPFGCLDPQMKVKQLLMEPLKLWRIGQNAKERNAMIADMLRECGLPEDALEKRTREFSGGQLQRIAIARALLLKPKFLVADEIVSALDIPVQNQILELLLQMKESYGLTILFITHDLAVVQRLSDRIIIMKQGRIVERGMAADIFENSSQSYVKELEKAVFHISLFQENV